MIAALVLAFREGLEAALILGVVLSVLKRVGQPGRARYVWLGAGLAALASLVVGMGLYSLGVAFEGSAEEAFEGVAMLLAAAVLTWMIFWMGRQGRAVQAALERDVRQATRSGGAWTLFSLAFVAVLREGIELALFLLAAAFTAEAGATLLGGAVGLGAAALAGWLLLATTARLNLRAFNSEGYSFLEELLLASSLAGARLAEVPITFVERREGQSKLSGGVVLEAVWMLAQSAWRRVFARQGLIRSMVAER